MHAFPTRIPGRRFCRWPAFRCAMISWINLARTASASLSHATLWLRLRLSAQHPTSTFHHNPQLSLIPSDTPSLPVCLNLHNTAEPLIPTCLFATTTQGARNYDQQRHQLFASAAAKSAPKTTTSRPRVEPGFSFLSQGPFYLPNECLCGTSDRWATSAGQYGRTPKAPEDQGCRLQVYCFPITLVLNFLQDFDKIMLSESNVFLLLHATNISGFSGYQSAFPGSQLYQALRRFSFSCCQSHLPRLYHVICPPVTGFHPKARRNMACGKYSAKHMEMAPQAGELRGTHRPLRTFQSIQSPRFPQSIPSVTAPG
jgi:hypothetical protein